MFLPGENCDCTGRIVQAGVQALDHALDPTMVMGSVLSAGGNATWAVAAGQVHDLGSLLGPATCADACWEQVHALHSWARRMQPWMQRRTTKRLYICPAWLLDTQKCVMRAARCAGGHTEPGDSSAAVDVDAAGGAHNHGCLVGHSTFRAGERHTPDRRHAKV